MSHRGHDVTVALGAPMPPSVASAGAGVRTPHQGFCPYSEVQQLRDRRRSEQDIEDD